jgi:hypothetical protein
MTEGSSEVIELVLSWLVTNALTFTVVILDERKWLDEAQLERAWPPSSRDAAIVAFGVLALPVHFIKTRGHFRSLRGVLGIPLGLLLGLAAVLLVAALSTLVLEGFALIFGLPQG